MKILMLTWEYPPRVVGGIARVVYDLSKTLYKDGHDVTVITYREGDAPYFEDDKGVKVYRVDNYMINPNNFIDWVLQLNFNMIAKANEIMLKEGNFDVIHAHDWLVAYSAKTLKNSYNIQIEKSDSSIITYEYFQTEDISWYHDYKNWKGLKSFGLVKKTIDKNGIKSVELRYYISSLYNDIETFSKAIRQHWSVENKLHWHLDFTFKQDDNSTMDKNALFNLQILKKLSLAFLNDVKRIYNRSLKRIRFWLSLDYENEILRFFNILAH